MVPFFSRDAAKRWSDVELLDGHCEIVDLLQPQTAETSETTNEAAVSKEVPVRHCIHGITLDRSCSDCLAANSAPMARTIAPIA